MDNFLYSINTTLPIFLVMALGWILRQSRMLNDNFVGVANKFNFNVTLPVLLFHDLASVNLKEVFNFKYVLFCALASSLSFWGIWGGVKLLIKDKSIRGAFVQASFRSSAAIMGIAFIENLYGASVMGPLMIIGAVPLYNIYSVLVLTIEADAPNGTNNTAKLKEAFVNILKNPIIIAIICGLFTSYFHLTFPTIINKTINSIAQIATPLALIVLGAGFEGKKALSKIKPTLMASLIKLVILPAVILPIACALKFGGEEMIGILAMVAAPATPSCYIMAKNMHNDGVLTASIIVLTTLLAAFTMTAWIFILKTLQII